MTSTGSAADCCVRIARTCSANRNRPHFGDPNVNLASTAYGSISSQANTPRDTQLALKVVL